MNQRKLDEKYEGYQLGEDDLLIYKGRLFIPNCVDFEKLVMDEIHQIPYFGYLGYQNTIKK